MESEKFLMKFQMVSYEQRLSSVIVSLLLEVLVTCDFLKRNTTHDDMTVSNEIRSIVYCKMTVNSVTEYNIDDLLKFDMTYSQNCGLTRW